MPHVAEAQKRLIPVLVNRASNVQISVGRGINGSFEGSKLLMLVSGQNLIAEEVWKEARKQSSVKRLLRVKISATGAPEDAEARIGRTVLEEGTPLNANSPLRGLSEDEALLFVSNTESLTLLEELATQEASGQVLRAINQKISALKNPKNQPTKK